MEKKGQKKEGKIRNEEEKHGCRWWDVLLSFEGLSFQSFNYLECSIKMISEDVCVDAGPLQKMVKLWH